MRVLLLLLLGWVATCEAAPVAPCPDSKVTLPQFGAGTAIIFGEVHGSNEAPAYLLATVCSTLSQFNNQPLIVALEYPVTEQPYLAGFLSSHGKPSDQAAFLKSPFWKRPMQDGRSSLAMLNLLENLRVLRARHPNLSVAPFVDTPKTASTHDAVMAGRLDEQHLLHPKARLLVLVGNLHAKRSAGFGGNPSYQSMARLLKIPNRSYAFATTGGTVWACELGCGIQPAANSSDGTSKANGSLDRPRPSINFDGIIDLGAVTASPPANTEPTHLIKKAGT